MCTNNSEKLDIIYFIFEVQIFTRYDDFPQALSAVWP